MKKIILPLLAFIATATIACNNNADTPKDDHAGMDMNDKQGEHMTSDDKEIKVVKASFTNVDAGVQAYMKSMTDHYLAVKNALTQGNAKDAAGASKKMTEAMKGFDKSLLTTEQKKVYDDNEEDLKEHAEHIYESSNDIGHQRNHFSMMSEDMYALVKSFGGGRTLYHDHCPMAKDNKGAMWLSETKDITNPYFGDKMMTCGSVEEMIQ